MQKQNTSTSNIIATTEKIPANLCMHPSPHKFLTPPPNHFYLNPLRLLRVLHGSSLTQNELPSLLLRALRVLRGLFFLSVFTHLDSAFSSSSFLCMDPFTQKIPANLCTNPSPHKFLAPPRHHFYLNSLRVLGVLRGSFFSRHTKTISPFVPLLPEKRPEMRKSPSPKTNCLLFFFVLFVSFVVSFSYQFLLISTPRFHPRPFFVWTPSHIKSPQVYVRTPPHINSSPRPPTISTSILSVSSVFSVVPPSPKTNCLLFFFVLFVSFVVSFSYQFLLISTPRFHPRPFFVWTPSHIKSPQVYVRTPPHINSSSHPHHHFYLNLLRVLGVLRGSHFPFLYPSLLAPRPPHNYLI